MSYQEKLDAARLLVEEHNKVLGVGEKQGAIPGSVDPEKFIHCLKVAGGTTEERLKGFSYEDILSCMPAYEGVKPVALAKDIAKIFRGKDEPSQDKAARPVSSKKADKMTLRELVENYDPEEATNPVAKRLEAISRGEKFIVFSTGRVVDVETTLRLLEEVKRGYDGLNVVEVDGDTREVHNIGSLPDDFVDENPLYKGRPLRPDGVCDQTNRSWNGVCMKVRQLVRIALEVGDLTDISIEKAHYIMDMVMGDKAWEKLSQRYKNAVVEYKKRDGLGTLPKLKLTLKKKGGSERKPPFQQAKKVNLAGWAANQWDNEKWPNLHNPYNEYYMNTKWR